MLDKTKNGLTIILIVVTSIAIVYGLVKIIMNIFSAPEIVTSENITSYMVKENLVTNYYEFYKYSDYLDNFIEACSRNEYKELYNLYLDDYKREYTKDEVMNKMAKISSIANNPDIDNPMTYDLNKLYKVNNDCILAFTINDKPMYMVFREKLKENYDYNFAFIK